MKIYDIINNSFYIKITCNGSMMMFVEAYLPIITYMWCHNSRAFAPMAELKRLLNLQVNHRKIKTNHGEFSIPGWGDVFYITTATGVLCQ